MCKCVKASKKMIKEMLSVKDNVRKWQPLERVTQAQFL